MVKCAIISYDKLFESHSYLNALNKCSYPTWYFSFHSVNHYQVSTTCWLQNEHSGTWDRKQSLTSKLWLKLKVKLKVKKRKGNMIISLY